MFKRSIACTLLALSCLPLQAQTAAPLTPSQQAAWKDLEQKLLNPEAWKKPDSRSSPLDLLIYVTGKSNVLNSKNGDKIELTLPGRQLTFHLSMDGIKRGIPVRWTPAPNVNAAHGSPEWLEIGNAVAQMNMALAAMDAPCQLGVTAPAGIECSVTAINLLDYLVQVEAADCPAQGGAACTQVNGKPVLLRPPAKRQPRRAQSSGGAALNAALAVIIRESAKRFEWTFRDQSGHALALPPIVATSRPEDAVIHVVTRLERESMPDSAFSQWIQLGTMSPARIQHYYAMAGVRDAGALASAVVTAPVPEAPVKAVAAAAAPASAAPASAAPASAAPVRAAAVKPEPQAARSPALKSADRLLSMADKDTALTAVKLVQSKHPGVCGLGETGSKALEIRSLVLETPAFRRWVDHGVVPKVSGSRSLDSLVSGLKKSYCSVVVDTAANVAALVAALDKDGVAVSVLDTSFDARLLTDNAAQRKGFRSDAEREFAQAMGNLSPAAIDRLREAGLADMASVEKATARMKASGYAGGGSNVLQFRLDEIAGAPRKMSANQVYEARLSRESAYLADYRGLSDEQAALKAYARIQTIRDPQQREFSSENCRAALRMAEGATTALEKEVTWRNARLGCIGNTPH